MIELLLFTSASCLPCKTLKVELARQRVSPTVIEASFETQSKFEEFGVRAVPTLVVLKDGKEVDRLTGAMKTPAQLRNLLDKWDV